MTISAGWILLMCATVIHQQALAIDMASSISTLKPQRFGMTLRGGAASGSKVPSVAVATKAAFDFLDPAVVVKAHALVFIAFSLPFSFPQIKTPMSFDLKGKFHDDMEKSHFGELAKPGRLSDLSKA